MLRSIHDSLHARTLSDRQRTVLLHAEWTRALQESIGTVHRGGRGKHKDPITAAANGVFTDLVSILFEELKANGADRTAHDRVSDRLLKSIRRVISTLPTASHSSGSGGASTGQAVFVSPRNREMVVCGVRLQQTCTALISPPGCADWFAV